LGDRKGIQSVKMLGVGLLVVEICMSYSSSKVIATITIILSSNKIQNGHILIPAYLENGP